MNIATRDAYGKTLVEIIDNKDIVVLDSDLAKATKTIEFKKTCSSRFFDMGISEQDMISTAAGLATVGKIPFASTFAIFGAGRAFEQIRNSVAYPNLNVKIAVTHAGITVGEDGGTHQSIEDIALMRSIPNMVILNPADAVEARLAVLAAVDYKGPVYLRFGRVATPKIYDEKYKFEIGKGSILKDGDDVVIFATGIMVAKALEAAEILRNHHINVSVVNIHTIKPLDNDLVLRLAKKTNNVVVCEEHSVIGGLGSAICEVLSQEYPTKVRLVGIKDAFGQSGTPNELLEHYKLTTNDIILAVKSMVKESIVQ